MITAALTLTAGLLAGFVLGARSNMYRDRWKQAVRLLKAMEDDQAERDARDISRFGGNRPAGFEQMLRVANRRRLEDKAKDIT